MNTWNRMHRFIKIGLVVDFVSMLELVVGLVFGGSSIANVIGFSFLGIAIILIATGAIKMRRAHYEYEDKNVKR